MRVTLKDIVEKTGVSKSVVSMYLNKDPRVWLSDEKKKRIDAAVLELGYSPSRTACALRKRHTRLLGLVIGGITDPYFSHLAEACLIYADRRGYKVLISLASVWGAEKERVCLETLIEQQVDGIVYAPIPVFDETFCEKLEKTRIPLIHFSEQFDRFLSMRRNLADAYDAAAAFLRSRGHKQVTKTGYANTHDLLFFKDRAARAGLNTVFQGTHKNELAETFLKSRPSAIYCHSPDAMVLCERIRNEAPEYHPDIIVDYYFPFDFVKDERIAGVVTGDFYARIRLAVDQLIARIENPDAEVSPHSYVSHTFYKWNEFLKIKNQLPDTMEKSERKIL